MLAVRVCVAVGALGIGGWVNVLMQVVCSHVLRSSVVERGCRKAYHLEKHV